MFDRRSHLIVLVGLVWTSGCLGYPWYWTMILATPLLSIFLKPSTFFFHLVTAALMTGILFSIGFLMLLYFSNEKDSVYASSLLLYFGGLFLSLSWSLLLGFLTWCVGVFIRLGKQRRKPGRQTLDDGEKDVEIL